MAPMTSLPALIGTPPGVPTASVISGAGGAAAHALPVSAEVRLKVSALNAFLRLKSMVCGPAPSSCICTLIMPELSTIVTVTR